MKATLFAVVLSLFVVSLPSFAVDENNSSKTLSLAEQQVNKINLNTADALTLTQSFKGIGKKRAEAIVGYREKHGNFKSVAELADVRGIGKSFVNKNLSELQDVFAVE